MAVNDPSSIELQFHQQMHEVYRRAKDECGYNATRFYQMVEEQGGLQAAKMLLASKRIPDGFAKLFLLGRLDISMETLVLQEPWSSLFTAAELAVARRRLGNRDRQAGKTIP